MLLSQTWLRATTRNLHQSSRQIPPLRSTYPPRTRPVEADDAPVVRDAFNYRRTDTHNQYFTGNRIPSKGRSNGPDNDIEAMLRRMKDIHLARRLARIRARNEHHAELDRIQSRLTPTSQPVDPLNGPDRNQTDLLAMQNMFWHVDHPARASRGDSIQYAVRSIAQHNRIAADEDTLCMYCDGAKFFWGAGAAVVVPRLRYSFLKRITRAEFSLGYDSMYRDDVSSAATELFGLVLALEAAVKFARPRQRVAVFCDAQGTVDLNRKIWADTNGLGGEPLRRATAAVDELSRRKVTTRMYWLAKNLIVPGSQLAHTCARKAAHKEPGEEVEVSERTWKQDMASEAANEVRQTLYHKD